MEGFKNLVPQFALVRRNGGEKITVRISFTITDKKKANRKTKTNTQTKTKGTVREIDSKDLIHNNRQKQRQRRKNTTTKKQFYDIRLMCVILVSNTFVF